MIAADPRWTGRRILTTVLLWLTTVLTILAIIAIWANRQVLNAENWSATSTRLLQDPTVRSATAQYLVDQLYENVDVSGAIGSALPAPLKGLAGPVAGALRNAAVSATEQALSEPAVQSAWAAANKTADQALIDLINGGNRHVTVTNGEVTLNLSAIVDDLASQLGISADLSSKLPPSIAHLVILRSNQIKLVQDIGRTLKGLALVLTILVPLLYIAAIAIAAGRRRRTLMWVGVSAVVAGLVVILFRTIIVSYVADALIKDQALRPAGTRVASIATTMLTEIAGAVVLIGVVVMICAWFAGPSRFAVPLRRRLAPVLRHQPLIVFAVVAALLLLIFIWQPIPSTGRPLGMLVYAVLALVGVEALRRETNREFPAPIATAGAPPLASPVVAPPRSAEADPAPVGPGQPTDPADPDPTLVGPGQSADPDPTLVGPVGSDQADPTPVGSGGEDPTEPLPAEPAPAPATDGTPPGRATGTQDPASP